MSGGSWEYFYNRLEDVADRLMLEPQGNRKALGRQLKLAAKALHDIEWVDSGDCSDGDEDKAIEAALGKDSKALILHEKISEAIRVREELDESISKAYACDCREKMFRALVEAAKGVIHHEAFCYQMNGLQHGECEKNCRCQVGRIKEALKPFEGERQ